MRGRWANTTTAVPAGREPGQLRSWAALVVCRGTGRGAVYPGLDARGAPAARRLLLGRQLLGAERRLARSVCRLRQQRSSGARAGRVAAAAGEGARRATARLGPVRRARLVRRRPGRRSVKGLTALRGVRGAGLPLTCGAFPSPGCATARYHTHTHPSAVFSVIAAGLRAPEFATLSLRQLTLLRAVGRTGDPTQLSSSARSNPDFRRIWLLGSLTELGDNRRTLSTSPRSRCDRPVSLCSTR
eukprot:ctg_1371.g456